MKRRAVCVLVFPVECFVDKKEFIFVLGFTFQDLLKCLLCFWAYLFRSLQYGKWLKAAKKINHGATICCFINLMIPTCCLFLSLSDVFFEIDFPQCWVHIKSQPWGEYYFQWLSVWFVASLAFILLRIPNKVPTCGGCWFIHVTCSLELWKWPKDSVLWFPWNPSASRNIKAVCLCSAVLLTRPEYTPLSCPTACWDKLQFTVTLKIKIRKSAHVSIILYLLWLNQSC